MAYTDNEKSTGLDVLTTLATGDLHIVGDVSDSGRAKAITEDNLEIVIANSATFLSELTTNATFIAQSNPLTTKGDIFTYSTAPARLPVGTNGQFLTADSSEATGLKWVTSSLGGGGGGTKLAIDTTETTVTGDTNPHTVYTVNIPGGTLGTNNAIRFRVIGSTGSASASVDVNYGGQVVSTLTALGAGGDWELEGVIIGDGSTSAQKSEVRLQSSGYTTPLIEYNAQTVSSASDQNLTVVITLNNGADTVIVESIIVEEISSKTASTSGVSAGPVASATQTITHGLGRIPQIIRVSSIGEQVAGQSFGFSFGTYNSTGNRCIAIIANALGVTPISSTTYAVHVSQNGQDASGVIQNVGLTTFDIVWTASGSCVDTKFIWEAQ